ncbi:MAG: class I SAM-dependent methyltransferase [Ignavibacteriales bacterium]|nr:MAG: class I SAM-dependent methyltransferase [Ignavibacteriales bacterium]
MHKNKIISAAKFYDGISEFYDKMIDFENNLALRIKAYQNIFTEQGKAADIGCGIGLDSIALALNGHSVTAFDISPKMIEQTNLNAAKYNVNISSQVHSFQTISKRFSGKFNYVVSVGNTIAHVNTHQLKETINVMYRLLLPGGKIFIHILNYKLIKKQNKRINNIANRDGKIIIRFYDFRGKNLDFNILSFLQNSPKEFKLVTTKHYPHTKDEIGDYLKVAGFTKVKFTKNFSGERFNASNSKDLFVEAVRKL